MPFTVCNRKFPCSKFLKIQRRYINGKEGYKSFGFDAFSE